MEKNDSISKKDIMKFLPIELQQAYEYDYKKYKIYQSFLHHL